MSGQTVLHVVEQVWYGKSKGGGHESGGSGRECWQRSGGDLPALVTGGSKGDEAARFLAEEAVDYACSIFFTQPVTFNAMALCPDHHPLQL